MNKSEHAIVVALIFMMVVVVPISTNERADIIGVELLETIKAYLAHKVVHSEIVLEVVHGWHLPGESRLTFGRTRISRAKREGMRAMAEVVHRPKAADLMELMQNTIPSADLPVVREKPTAALRSFAERERSDLIVIGTADPSGVAGMLRGGPAESVVEIARTSVLAIKPQGFTSPIKPRSTQNWKRARRPGVTSCSRVAFHVEKTER